MLRFTMPNIFFLVTYLLCAAVQYNDPDALHWITLYLSAAAMCAARLRKRLPEWLPRLLFIVSLLWMGTLLPNIIGQVSPRDVTASISMQTTGVEEAREIGGLFLVAFWSGMIALRRSIN
ncbi:MAG: hypothetical protein HN744_05175 [Halieaceae bacterium]|jgi:hypothetical protein|nr:hypothetical protein [Halieaceae bacterium]